MRLKNLLIGAAGLATLAGSANAAVVTLQSHTGTAGNYTFNYQATLGPDEGLRTGDNIVIYDFAGYIPGSIFSSNATLVASTALTTPGPIIGGQTDNPTLTNLIFTYTGPDFRDNGGPFAPLDFNGLGARSIYNNTVLKAFTTNTTKNNPVAAADTPVVTLGEDLAPTAGVPEPAAWTMLIAGFGLVGAIARRRRPAIVAA